MGGGTVFVHAVYVQVTASRNDDEILALFSVSKVMELYRYEVSQEKC